MAPVAPPMINPAPAFRGPRDDRTQDGAADGASGGAAPGRVGRLHHDALIGIRVGTARVHAGLLHRPDMAFVAIAVGLLRTLAVRGIHENLLRRRRRPRRMVRGGGVAQAATISAAAIDTVKRNPAWIGCENEVTS